MSSKCRCDNPPCCNPFKCLFLGTNADNMADMVAKRRHASHSRSGYMPSGEDHHARQHPERMARGERNAAARLTEADVREIRRRWDGRQSAGRRVSVIGNRLQDLADEFGVAKGTITFIVQRKTWKHVTDQE